MLTSITARFSSAAAPVEDPVEPSAVLSETQTQPAQIMLPTEPESQTEPVKPTDIADAINHPGVPKTGVLSISVLQLSPERVLRLKRAENINEIQ